MRQSKRCCPALCALIGHPRHASLLPTQNNKHSFAPVPFDLLLRYAAPTWSVLILGLFRGILLNLLENYHKCAAMSRSVSDSNENQPGASGHSSGGQSSGSFAIGSFYKGRKASRIRLDSSDESDVDDPSFVPLNMTETESETDDVRETESESGIGNGNDNTDVSSGVSGSVGAPSVSVSGGGDSGDETPRRKRAPKKTIEKNGRVRKRQEEKWEKNIAKKKRNLGQEYVAYGTKKVVSARQVGPPCNDGCFDKLGRDEIDAIFKSFWAIGNYDAQNAYLQGLIRPQAVKRKRTKAAVSRQPINYVFFVKVRGHDFRVCRKGFTSIFGLGEKKVKILIKKIRGSPNGTPVPDKRGKFPSPRAIGGVRLQRVHEHIASLPLTASHYTRATTPHRRYLECGGSISTVYFEYEQWMIKTHGNEARVSERFYRTVFTRDYNIVFATPKSDVCATCERFEMLIKTRKQENGDSSILESELATHKVSAQVPRQLLQQAENGVFPDENTRVIAIDLQQTLPCPRIRTSIAYYKRKLWVYNFCVYDINKEEATMFVWHEVTAGRGADEMASCLMKWLDQKMDIQGEDFTKLRIFCDNCAGQNKNLFMLLMALRQVHAKRLSRVEFIFMKSGHSYLPCDRAFGHIEKKVRNNSIFYPKNYSEIIATSVKRGFPVVEMERADFFDVKSLKDHITERKGAGFSQACQLVVDINFRTGYKIKTTYNLADDDDNIILVNLEKGLKRTGKGKGKWQPKFDLSKVPLPLKYKEDRLLTKEKCEDLANLTAFITTEASEWFKDILNRQEELRQRKLKQKRRVLTTTQEDELEADPDNNIMDYASVVPLSSS